jgi:hypothetical protein
MRKLIFLAVLSAVLLAWINLLPAEEKVINSVAAITEYTGDVRIKHSGDYTFNNAMIGMPVFKDDILRTGRDSFVEVTFDDASIIRLDSDSSVTISTLNKEENTFQRLIDLGMGHILAAVSKLTHKNDSFEVTSKLAFAAVKGTQFVVVTEPSADTVGVFEGSVRTSRYSDKEGKDAVLLPPGKEVSVKEKGKLEMTDMDKITKFKGIMSLLQAKHEKVQDILKKISFKEYIESLIKKKDEESNLLLKERAANENSSANRQAFFDLDYLQKEKTQDSREGRVLIDVMGRKYRLEEYVTRPNAQEIDYASITERKDRTDYILSQHSFTKYAPSSVNDPSWTLYYWPNTVAPPDINYLTWEKYSFVNKNTSNKVEMRYTYAPIYFNSSTSVNTLTMYWRLALSDYVLAVNGNIEEHKVVDLLYPGSGDMAALSGDKNVDYMMTAASDDKTWGILPADSITPFTYVRPYSQEVTTDPVNALYPEKVVKHYNDGTDLTMTMYVIDDSGKSYRIPVNDTDWLAMRPVMKIEMNFQSNSFTQMSGISDIDLISTFIWDTLYTNNPDKQPPPVVVLHDGNIFSTYTVH